VRHLPLTTGMILSYGIVNMTYTLITHNPIYKPLNFRDVMSYVWVTLLACLEIGGFIGLCYLTQWKLKKIQERDVELGTKMTVFSLEGESAAKVS